MTLKEALQEAFNTLHPAGVEILPLGWKRGTHTYVGIKGRMQDLQVFIGKTIQHHGRKLLSDEARVDIDKSLGDYTTLCDTLMVYALDVIDRDTVVFFWNENQV